ncbi:hypothetical protein [Actinokineospora inagensis]|uniref:hypothetical protein n=1 Tax=Actinokineospora inagensis TaxID=103730 RepID=UPI000408F125|nr:hypothetical protein [Actinokineospora inagensis]
MSRALTAAVTVATMMLALLTTALLTTTTASATATTASKATATTTSPTITALTAAARANLRPILTFVLGRDHRLHLRLLFVPRVAKQDEGQLGEGDAQMAGDATDYPTS